MKASIIVLAFSAVSAFATNIGSDHWGRFQDFIYDHAKNYTEVEMWHRFKVFSNNVDMIDKHNSLGGWQMGVNKFADLTASEFESTVKNGCFLEAKNSSLRKTKGCAPFTGLASTKDSIDWRDEGAVSFIQYRS